MGIILILFGKILVFGQPAWRECIVLGIRNRLSSIECCSITSTGVIAAILTFGDRINVHSHRHFLVTEGRRDLG